MAGESNAELAACSLVREYLSRKGFKSTLEKLDEECPRNEQSISNRQALMKYVHLDKLMRKNKEKKQPLRTMVEVMTQYFLDKGLDQQRKKANEKDGGDDDDGDESAHLYNAIDYLPRNDEPRDVMLKKSSRKPKSASLKSKQGRTSALVMDEDVDSETVLGSGKTGLLVLASDMAVDPVNITKQKPLLKRPLSAKKKAGAIMSNNDIISSCRKVPFAKSGGFSRLSVSEQQQQLKQSETSKNHCEDHSTIDKDNFDFKKPIYSKVTLDHPSFCSKEIKNEKSQKGSTPISFEALLMKGEERANLLQRVGLERKNLEPDDEGYSIECSSMVAENSSRDGREKSNQHMRRNSERSELKIGDVDDLDVDISGLELQRGTPLPHHPCMKSQLAPVPIDIKTAINLKNLMLGSPCQLYTEEWSLQAFSFCDIPNLRYGIVQKKGGPCGVLAAVQACLIQELLFGSEKLHAPKWSSPTRPERTKFLVQAIAQILWRAGYNERAVVTIPSQTFHLVTSSKFKQDGITETLSLYTFTKFDELSSFLSQSVSHFERDGSPGVILLIYSAILSRKPHIVKSDFDTPENKMIAVHGYCTQDLVNLLLTGRAVTNVFNDVIELKSEDAQDSVVLKGLSSRSEIGFLSLFEHYKSCQVGTYFKTPKYPIWIVCSESHFSVLFSTRKDLVNDWKAEKRFDLIYYDGLARQQEEIRLTISTINLSYVAPSSEEDLIPPLDHIIRTKWKDAEIDWNDYDPIL